MFCAVENISRANKKPAGKQEISWKIPGSNHIASSVILLQGQQKNTVSYKHTNVWTELDCYTLITLTSQWARWRLKSPAVYSTVYSGADQRRHQSSASLAFVRGFHRWPVNSTHKGPVTRKNATVWWRHHAAMTTCHDISRSNISLVNGTDKCCMIRPPGGVCSSDGHSEKGKYFYTILWQKCPHMYTSLSQTGELWDLRRVHSGVCATGQFALDKSYQTY